MSWRLAKEGGSPKGRESSRLQAHPCRSPIGEGAPLGSGEPEITWSMSGYIFGLSVKLGGRGKATSPVCDPASTLAISSSSTRPPRKGDSIGNRAAEARGREEATQRPIRRRAAHGRRQPVTGRPQSRLRVATAGARRPLIGHHERTSVHCTGFGNKYCSCPSHRVHERRS